jgi:hypothetical protein
MMLNRLFPRQFDNSYQGYSVAIWLLVPLVLVKLAMGANSLINTRMVAMGADKIPIDSFGPEGAATVIFLFRGWALGLLLLSLLGLVALIRYRSMIPLMFLVLGIEQVGRRVIQWMDPIPHAATSGGVSIAFTINLVLSCAVLIGFALSLATPPRTVRTSAA